MPALGLNLGLPDDTGKSTGLLGPGDGALILEDGTSYLLLEDGSKLLFE